MKSLNTISRETPGSWQLRSKFSVVVALYNVEKYLDTFLNSIIRQSYALANIEVIIVDDGSTDSSYELVRIWADKFPELIRHTSKTNGGPASARNVGLGLARNEWITFCDPDDALDEKYFERVATFIYRDRGQLATMLTTQVMIWQEESGTIKNTHPLGRKYSFGERLVDLNEEPNFAQLGGATIFLRLDVIEKNGLRLSELIKPTFEDAEFIGRYLASSSGQVIGIIPSAKYFYRKRGDGSSLVQSSWLKTERYADVLEHGYLALLKGQFNRFGYVPAWAQNMVIYDMCWYLVEETKMRSASAWVDGDLLESFHSLMMRIFYYIDRERIEKYNMSNMSWITRQAMLTYFKGANLFPQSAVRWSHPTNEMNLIGYAYSGLQPNERFLVDGVEVLPREAKSLRHDYYKNTFFYERKVWLPQGSKTEIWLDGRYVTFVPAAVPGWKKPGASMSLIPLPKAAATTGRGRNLSLRLLTTSPVDRVFDKARSRVAVERLVSESTVLAASSAIASRMIARKTAVISKRVSKRQIGEVSELALSKENRLRYKDAWIVVDRPDHAGDNAEHLYRYLMTEQPRTNAWFLLNRASSDWQRLEAEGFRLIEYGSKESVAAVLNSVVQISSDATADVQFPIGRKRYGNHVERFVFIQHGITMNDLSRWLNPKNIALICAATVKEYDAFVADEGTYKFTESQVALTGFPRFDELARLKGSAKNNSKRILMVMPTWRQTLRDGLAALKTDKERAEFLRNSEYGSAWLGLLSSASFLKFADTSDLEVVFVAHPAISEFVSVFDLPSSVRIARQAEGSLQDLFVSASVLLTDYSSVAFDVAFLDTPVVYYQFDAGDIFSGKHNYRQGYYDYVEQGFGPVVYSAGDVVRELEYFRSQNFELSEVYETRRASTFEYTDAQNSERVFTAIRSLIEES